MTEQVKTWTPFPKPCMVCLTKKRVNHDTSLPVADIDIEIVENQPSTSGFKNQMKAVNQSSQNTVHECVAGKNLVDDITRNNEKNVTKSDRKTNKPQKCLSLKRGANFSNQKMVPPAKQLMSKKNTIKRETQTEKNGDKSNYVTFNPKSKQEFSFNSTENKNSKPLVFNQSNIKTTSSDFTRQKSFTIQTKIFNEISVPSTSKQAKTQSWFQKTTESKQSADEDRDICDSSREVDDPLTLCPLCQMNFPLSWTQIQRDGHIATCLSESGDDVIW